MNTLFLLYYEFFKIGCFAIGGGYATIPFLFHLTKIYNWFSISELTDMIAVSNITPGPIGINMATYAGFSTYGLIGAIISTLGIISGPFILTLLVIYFINKFKNSNFLKTIFDALRPASCALLSFVMIKLINQNIINTLDIKALIITVILFIIYKFLKDKPSLVIFAGAILGIIFHSF